MAAFAKVPAALVKDPQVSDMAVRVYAALLPYEWRFHTYGEKLPSMAQVGRDIGRSVDSVQRSVIQLERAGWLARETARNRTVWLKLNTALPKGAARIRRTLGTSPKE